MQFTDVELTGEIKYFCVETVIDNKEIHIAIEENSNPNLGIVNYIINGAQDENNDDFTLTKDQETETINYLQETMQREI